MKKITAVFLTFILLLACTAGTAEKIVPAPDFTLKDQYGNSHTLSEYQGKVVFLNLWATWCPYCLEEMPDIEKIYHDLGENQKDVVILGLACPPEDVMDEAGIIDYLKKEKLTYPVLFDGTGEVFKTYGLTGLPTSWFIRADGNLLGYFEGMLSGEQMLYLIQVALEATAPEEKEQEAKEQEGGDAVL